MATILVFEFPSDGPFGTDAVAAYQGLAEHIAQEHGLVWKVWTEDAGRKVAGGVYLFDNAADAKRYTAFHTERLASFGITQIDARSFDVNDGLSAITRGLAG
ncbi:MAG: monooxygenase [Arachnia sp.]